MWLQQGEGGIELRGRRKPHYRGPGHTLRIMGFTLIPYFSGEIHVLQRSPCLGSVNREQIRRVKKGNCAYQWSKQEIRDLDQCGDREADKVKTSGR